jgi:hypothetical protein
MELVLMQKLEPNSVGKVKQKLISAIPLEISISNETEYEIHYDCEEVPNGVRPKVLIKIKQLKKVLKGRK